jgi:dipeptidyl aminopeptidase/acylaminoacyl peptidase
MKYYLFLGLFVPVLGFNQKTLSPETLLSLDRISGGIVSPDGKKILYEVKTISIEKNNGQTDLYVYDIAENKSKQLTFTAISEFDAQWGNDNTIWYLSNENGSNQIWKINSDGSNKTQFTNINELEIEGFKLAPDLKSLVIIAPIKMKTTLKDKHPDLQLSNARMETDLMFRHWNYWQDDSKRHLFLFEIENNTLKLNYKDLLENQYYDGIVPPFGGSEQIIYSPDSKKIIYNSKKKNGKSFAQSTNSDLFEYNIETGKTINLTSNYKGYDSNQKFSTDGKFLTWLSMKSDGFEADKNDLILRDLTSNQDINLTQNHDITVDDYCFSKDLKSLYLIVPYKGSKQLFELIIRTSELKQLSKNAQDFLSINVADELLITTRQSLLEPTDLYSFSLKTKKESNLTQINHEKLKDIEKPSFQERWVETTDGKKMHVWLVLPPKFDPKRKYPTILYCNGGPQSMVSQFFSYRWNLALLASQGYVIIAPNRRGLPGFGQDWNDAISKDWGGQAMKDYLSAVDEISKEPFIDKARLGAVGASYGGYSVYYLAGIHDGRFKTFISHCGLFNLESWYGTTEELFFANWDNKGPYWINENKEYYEKNSPHKLVENWNTPMLVIHGGLDYRVPESEGMQAFQALQIKGIKSKFLYFPSEGHWITSPQNGILWYREFIEWLDTDLKK